MGFGRVLLSPPSSPDRGSHVGRCITVGRDPSSFRTLNSSVSLPTHFPCCLPNLSLCLPIFLTSHSTTSPSNLKLSSFNFEQPQLQAGRRRNKSVQIYSRYGSLCEHGSGEVEERMQWNLTLATHR